MNVPTTIEEVEAKFKADYPEDICDCLIGIFHCEIKMGKSVLEAYKEALLSYLKGARYEQ